MRLAVVPELRASTRSSSARASGPRPAARAPLRPRRAARRDHAERTKLVYVCVPNNPTGTTNGRAELTRFLDQVPGHVLTVLDQAYAEYIDDPDYPDGVEEYFKAGRRVIVLRTFSKIYGLAGLRVGYGIAPEDVVPEIGKVRRAFDVTLGRRRSRRSRASATSRSSRAGARRVRRRRAQPSSRFSRDAGFDVAGPAVANFVYADTGSDARRALRRASARGRDRAAAERLRIGHAPFASRSELAEGTDFPRSWLWKESPAALQ